MSWSAKKVFVDGTVESCSVKRERDQKSDNSQRNLTFKYSLPLFNGKKKNFAKLCTVILYVLDQQRFKD